MCASRAVLHCYLRHGLDLRASHWDGVACIRYEIEMLGIGCSGGVILLAFYCPGASIAQAEMQLALLDTLPSNSAPVICRLPLPLQRHASGETSGTLEQRRAGQGGPLEEFGGRASRQAARPVAVNEGSTRGFEV